MTILRLLFVGRFDAGSTSHAALLAVRPVLKTPNKQQFHDPWGRGWVTSFMSYLAIARKWRPHKFEDLVGQLHVVQTLKNAIVFDRVSHAYLFCGARGVGKTSVARIFAKALRCPNSKEAVPCNTCEECVAISESRSVDVAEIDGASNNGVEAVRNLRDNVAYGAATGKFKIYIIDEVHMLSTAAFNALLKTLEEPPEHVVFIFATTEVQKIPLTILSRCQRFEFRRLTTDQVTNRLVQILEAEKINIDAAGLRTIAQHGDGSLRDSLSLLDQVLSFYSDKRDAKEAITNKEVVEALGISESSAITSFWDFILQKDTKAILQVIGETYMSGVDLKHFSERCLEELRLLYLVSLAQEGKTVLTANELDISQGHFARLEEMSKNAKPLTLERMAQILSKVISQLAWSSLPRFVLEMASIRMTKLDELDKIAIGAVPEKQVVQENAAPKFERPTIVKPPAPAPVAAPAQKVAPAGATANRPTPPPQQQQSQPPQNTRPPHDSEEGMWRGFVEHVMKKRPILATLLTHANYRIQKSAKGTALILAFAEESFFEKQVRDKKNHQDAIEQVQTFFGPDAILEISNITKGTNQSIEELRTKEAEGLRKSALEHPTVAQMQNVLGAEVVDVQVDI